MESKSKKTVLWKLFLSTFYLSTFTFGGGYVIVSLMKKKFVDEYHWIDENEMLDLVAIAQSAPGAVAVNGAIAVGYKLAGLTGVVTAVFGTLLPQFVIIAAISVCYQIFCKNFIVSQMLLGMQAGVGAVIAVVVYEMAGEVAKQKDAISWIIMAAAFLAATVFQVNVVYIVIASGLLGFYVQSTERGKYHDLSEIIFCISSDWNVQFWRRLCGNASDTAPGSGHVSLVRWERVRRSCHDLADDTWPDRHKCSYVCRNEHGRACGSSDCNVWMYSAVLYFGYIYCLLLFKISKARSTSGYSFFPASGSDRTDRIGRHFHLGFCLLERTDCDPSAGYRLGHGDSVRPLHRAASEM